MARGRDLMRGLALLASLALAAWPCAARAAEIVFVYAHPNVGGASGGHAAFGVGEAIYHVQTDGAGLYRIVRDSWAHFAYVYGELQNRPLSIAHVAVSDEVRDALADRFTRVYVEQDLDYARRQDRALDVAWLEPLREGRPLPPLAAAGLLSPRHAGDPEARALAERVRQRSGASVLASADIALHPHDPGLLREELTLREALRALEHAYGLDPEALAVLPPSIDDPLTSAERSALESLAMRLERSIAELLGSTRPDRGRALLLEQARFLAVRRSLAENRLRLLDPFDGRPELRAEPGPPPSAAARTARLAYLARVLRRGRAVVLTPGGLDEASYNALEEAAGVIERAARSDPDAQLLDVARRLAPVRGRSVALAAREHPPEAQLAAARLRLERAETRLRERWGYALLQRNCITELSEVIAGAFPSLAAADAALGGRIPAGEPLAAIPAVFFSRVSERLRVSRIEHRPSRRARALARLTEHDPRPWVRARESVAPLSHIYTPTPRDGAFLLFTDDVLWRRPVYGTANLAYGLGYAALGIFTSPLDRGTRWRAGIAGALWSLPELAFQNVRKGTFEFVEPREP